MKGVFFGRFWSRLILGSLLLVLFPTAAFAYLDPGTGSFIIQGIIGAVVGGAFVIKLYWKRVKAALTGKPIEEEDPDE